MMDSTLESNQPFYKFKAVCKVLSQNNDMLLHCNCIKSQPKAVFGRYELPYVLFT